MTTTTAAQKTRYYEVLPHRSGGDRYDLLGHGDPFTTGQVGRVLARSNYQRNVSHMFDGRPSVRLSVSDTPGSNSGPIFPLDVLREVGEFHKGQRVYIRQGAESIGYHRFDVRTEGIVTMNEDVDFPRRLVRVADGKEYSVHVDDLSRSPFPARSAWEAEARKAVADFTLTTAHPTARPLAGEFMPSKAPRWDAPKVNDVKPGDTVTLHHADGTHIPNRVVDSVYSVKVGRRREYVRDLLSVGYVLAGHKPAAPSKPVLPTERGSVITANGEDYIRTGLKSDQSGEAVWVSLRTGGQIHYSTSFGDKFTVKRVGPGAL